MKNHKHAHRMSPVVRIEEVESARISLSIVVTLSVFILGGIIWAGFTQIDEVVVSSGDVVPVSKVYTIQNQDGGVIQSILVKDGEEVQAGQTLVIFDPTVPRLELQQLMVRNAAIINSGQELQKLLDIGQKNAASLHGPDAPEANVYGSIQKENTSNASTQNTTEPSKSLPNRGPKQLSPIENQYLSVTDFKTEAEKDIADFNTLLDILTKRLTIMLQEKSMYEKLISQGVIAKKDYLELLRVITQVEEEINKAQAAHLETQYAISKLEQRLNNIEVKSPIHGLVQGLQIHISNVIQPGGYLMDIVPLENLIVEARIKSTDIGLVKVGDQVRVKVDTYDFTRFGDIEGKLINISATTFLENAPNAQASRNTSNAPYANSPSPSQGAAAFYKAAIQLKKSYVGNDPNKNKLLPGMTVIADIHIGTKSLLKYLLKPVKAAAETSFREQ